MGKDKNNKDKPEDVRDFIKSDEFLDKIGESDDPNKRVQDFLDGLKDDN